MRMPPRTGWAQGQYYFKSGFLYPSFFEMFYFHLCFYSWLASLQASKVPSSLSSSSPLPQRAASSHLVSLCCLYKRCQQSQPALIQSPFVVPWDKNHTVIWNKVRGQKQTGECSREENGGNKLKRRNWETFFLKEGMLKTLPLGMKFLPNLKFCMDHPLKRGCYSLKKKSTWLVSNYYFLFLTTKATCLL